MAGCYPMQEQPGEVEREFHTFVHDFLVQLLLLLLLLLSRFSLVRLCATP